jgi:hypothetical protein
MVFVLVHRILVLAPACRWLALGSSRRFEGCAGCRSGERWRRASARICEASAAVTTASPICILIAPCMRVRTLHHYQATALLRSLSSIGGVSNRTLAAQLAWIKKHPEAPTLFASTYVLNQAVTTAGWLCDTVPCIHAHCISGAGRHRCC